MSDELVLVTGATGKTGRRVVRLLDDLGVAHREASRTSATRFDWEDRSTWAPVLEGASALYLIPPYTSVDRAAEALAALGETAIAAGVRRTALVSTPDESGLAAEASLAASGLATTALRLRWFFQNFSEDFLRDPVRSGELRLPAGNGAEAFIDADDIAEAAVRVLTEDGHAGSAYELTGPRLLTFGDIAAAITAATGREVRYVPLTEAAFIAEQLAFGVPEDWARTSASLYAQIGSGRLASLSNDVERLLGRPPRDFAAFARAAGTQGLWT
jgi:uncharacterized protein YbjT (DUF2867 family)